MVRLVLLLVVLCGCSRQHNPTVDSTVSSYFGEVRYNYEEPCDSRYQFDSLGEVDYYGCIPFGFTFGFDVAGAVICFSPDIEIDTVLDLRLYDDETDVVYSHISYFTNCVRVVSDDDFRYGVSVSFLLSE